MLGLVLCCRDFQMTPGFSAKRISRPSVSQKIVGTKTNRKQIAKKKQEHQEKHTKSPDVCFEQAKVQNISELSKTILHFSPHLFSFSTTANKGCSLFSSGPDTNQARFLCVCFLEKHTESQQRINKQHLVLAC